MKYHKTSHILVKIFLILAIFMLIIFGTIEGFKYNHVYLYFFQHELLNIVPFTIYLAIIFGIMSLSIYIYTTFKTIGIIICTCIILLIVTFFSYMSYIFAGWMDSAYISFTSPDNQHQFIMKEKDDLFRGEGIIYEMISPIIMVPIGEYLTDDGYMPIKNGNFSIIWNKDNLVFTYNYGNAGVYKSEVANYVSSVDSNEISFSDITHIKDLEDKINFSDAPIQENSSNVQNIKVTSTGIEKGVGETSKYILENTSDEDDDAYYNMEEGYTWKYWKDEDFSAFNLSIAKNIYTIYSDQAKSQAIATSGMVWYIKQCIDTGWIYVKYISGSTPEFEALYSYGWILPNENENEN